MTKPKTKLSTKVGALVAAGASAAVIMGAFLDEKEGSSLKSYQDGVKVWTACRGVTKFRGRPIQPGMVFTKTECDDLDKTELFKALDELDRLVTVELSEPAAAGIGSFCTYNIGATKCKGSTFLKKLNSGDRVGACQEIERWIFDGGKDCRIRSNNCFGQVERRAQEKELCLM
jgi:lysozyme